jgi:hypothetical protein
MSRWFTWPKIIFYALVALLVAAWYVPQLNAERYRDPIHAGLEAALGRKVKIGEVKFRLLPVPGFTISDVEIGEDPALGPEPIAYVHTLRGRPRLSALFGGPLEFASVDLEDTSVNLTRADTTHPGDAAAQSDSLRWNFSSLMRPKLLAAFPSVHMISGRVNFKFGDTKSVFYLLNTDVDLWPPSRADDPWTFKVNAEPARTDRPSHGFGSFVARGELQPQKGLVTLDVKLEQSELGDMVTLFRGQESDLHGHIRGDAHLAGPLNRVGIAGNLRLDDIHGWNQTPPGGGTWPISVGGAIDIPGQVVDVRALTRVGSSGTQAPIDIRYRVTNYLARPRWGVTAIFSHLPVAPLIGIARNMGLSLPDGITFDGSADGAVGYSMPEGKARVDGHVRIGSSTLGFTGAQPLKVSDTDLDFAGSLVTIAGVDVVSGNGEKASISGTFDMDSGSLETTVASEGMSLESLHPQLSAAQVPLLSLAKSGAWSGTLRYSSLPQPSWSGDIRLKDADVPVDAFSTPLHIVLADATLSPTGLVTKRLSFSAGGTEGQGEYRYELGAAHPHRFRVNISRIDAAAIETLLSPALRRGNFLTTALGLGKVPEPDWMPFMHADGTVQIGSLNLGGSVFTKLKARILWDGDQIRMSGIQGSLPGSPQETAFNGSGAVSLASRQPHYDFAGTVAGYSWRSGSLAAEGTVSTFGTGIELLTNLKAEGKFHGRNLDVTSDEAWDRVDGSFEWAWNARNPRLKLDQLVIATGGGTFQGTADTRNDGQLVLKISDGTKQLQATGALLKGEPLKLAQQ